jgi:hypothetical protein
VRGQRTVLVRQLDRCVPEKFERARRIRQQAEMFAAMDRLESIESVMGETYAVCYTPPP